MEELEGKGFLTEIITAVLEEMGNQPEYQFVPWKRCESMLQRGQAWAAFPYVYTEERAKKFDFSTPISKSMSQFVYYGGKMKGVTWDQFEDLKSYKIGGVQGNFYIELFKKHGISLDLTTKEQYAIKKLIKGKIDLLPMNVIVGWDLIKKEYPYNVHKFGTLPKPIRIGYDHLIVSKSYPNTKAILTKFNTAFEVVTTKPIYHEILKKYHIKDQF